MGLRPIELLDLLTVSVVASVALPCIALMTRRTFGSCCTTSPISTGRLFRSGVRSPGPPSASGPGGCQLPPPRIIRAPRSRLPPSRHRAQTDRGRYALAPDYPAIFGAGRADDAEDPVRYADRHPAAPGSVAARQRRATRPADLRGPARGLPSSGHSLKEEFAQLGLQNLAATAGKRRGHGVRLCIVNEELGRT